MINNKIAILNEIRKKVKIKYNMESLNEFY